MKVVVRARQAATRDINTRPHACPAPLGDVPFEVPAGLLTREVVVRGPIAIAALVAVALPALAAAQPREKIPLALEVRSEGQASPEPAAADVGAAVRRGLSALPDVELVPSDGARRIVWIICGTTPGQAAVSMMITERYDRETLMVLGIEDDEMAFKMMALQIVSDHQIFTGRDAAAVAARVVTALDTGALARLRKLPPRP